MKTILTETLNKDGQEVYWHYHAIGTGIIVTYHISVKQVILTCQHTGQLIDYYDFCEEGGINKEEFRELCVASYMDAIDIGRTLDLDYFDDPTIVGCVGIDFNLLKN